MQEIICLAVKYRIYNNKINQKLNNKYIHVIAQVVVNVS